MDKQKSELNPRQWKLYQLLKARASQDLWTSQFTLYCFMSAFDDVRYPVVMDESKFHDSQARLIMTKDIRTINDSNIIQKIILSTSKGVKIANEEEWTKYKENKRKSLLSQLKRYSVLKGKALANGQMRITFGNEREIVEAFAND